MFGNYKLIRRPPSVFFTKVVDNINSSFCKRNLIYITNDYLYLDIPKSASSFIKSLIISSHKLSLDCGPQYPHSAVFERPRIYKDISNVKVISFIRDPIDRFCSVVREKFKLGSLDNNNKWSPYRFPLKSNTYKFNDVEKMIDKIVKLPYSLIDKHLLPQSYFIDIYISNRNLVIYETTEIKNIMGKILKEKFFCPSKSISLETDKSLFNKDNLSQESLQKLKKFYKNDFHYMTHLKKY